MFLKYLEILDGQGRVIRNIEFKLGLNLVVDETPSVRGFETGNNVGKTTVLKLIDYCLGGSQKEIYTDLEDRKSEYKLVKKFLMQKRVLIRLCLKEDLTDQNSRELLIERNFLSRAEKVQRIDGVQLKNQEFDAQLSKRLFPTLETDKPTYRQLLSHNIRYKEFSLTNTLKTLDAYTRMDEYESLYLFMFGCGFSEGDKKQEIRTKLDLELKFKSRLESDQSLSGYEAASALLKDEIQNLEIKKRRLDVNPEYESQLDRLNQVRYQISRTSSTVSRLEMRISLIEEAKAELDNGHVNIDLRELKSIYDQVTSKVETVTRKFDELVEFHNRMLDAKASFVTSDLEGYRERLRSERSVLARLRGEELTLAEQIANSDSFAALEEVLGVLNQKHVLLGEYKAVIKQIESVNNKVNYLTDALDAIDKDLYSPEFSTLVSNQLRKFNRYFASVSNEIYKEAYAIKYDIEDYKGRKLYSFKSINVNFSSGKKQGEISCFDIAYTLFADSEGLPCLHFLLNDKKELMHDNQLVSISKMVGRLGIQFVASILKDKLPEELNDEEYFAVRLSETNKLFRI